MLANLRRNKRIGLDAKFGLASLLVGLAQRDRIRRYQAQLTPAWFRPVFVVEGNV